MIHANQIFQVGDRIGCQSVLVHSEFEILTPTTLALKAHLVTIIHVNKSKGFEHFEICWSNFGNNLFFILTKIMETLLICFASERVSTD